MTTASGSAGATPPPGKDTWNEAPPPSRSSTHTRPPCYLTNPSTMASPSPVPGASVSPLRNGAKIVSRSASGTPGPWSSTTISAPSSCDRTSTHTARSPWRAGSRSSRGSRRSVPPRRGRPSRGRAGDRGAGPSHRDLERRDGVAHYLADVGRLGQRLDHARLEALSVEQISRSPESRLAPREIAARSTRASASSSDRCRGVSAAPRIVAVASADRAMPPASASSSSGRPRETSGTPLAPGGPPVGVVPGSA